MFNPRARSPPGPVTVRDAFAIYPYENTLAALELTGTDLDGRARALGRATTARTTSAGRTRRSMAADVPGYNFDTAEGVTYTIDLLAARRGARCANLSLARASRSTPTRSSGRGEQLPGQRRRRLRHAQARPRVSRSAMPARDRSSAGSRSGRRSAPTTDDNWRLVPEWAIESRRQQAPRSSCSCAAGRAARQRAAYRLRAPLTRRRFADVGRRARRRPIRSRPSGAKAGEAARTRPSTRRGLSTALDWRARPRGPRAALPARPIARAPLPGGTPGERAEFAAGRPLTVAEGATVLADVRLPAAHASSRPPTSTARSCPARATARTQPRDRAARRCSPRTSRAQRAKNPEGTVLSTAATGCRAR